MFYPSEHIETRWRIVKKVCNEIIGKTCNQKCTFYITNVFLYTCTQNKGAQRYKASGGRWVVVKVNIGSIHVSGKILTFECACIKQMDYCKMNIFETYTQVDYNYKLSIHINNIYVLHISAKSRYHQMVTSSLINFKPSDAFQCIFTKRKGFLHVRNSLQFCVNAKTCIKSYM